MLEDPRLHDSPEPWISTSRSSKTWGLFFGVVFLFIGVLLTVVSLSIFFTPVIFIGLIILILSYKGASDKKDSWYVRLGYSESYLNSIGYGVKEYLSNQKYEYSVNFQPKTGIFKKTPYWNFKIIFTHKDPLTVEIMFDSSSDEDSVEYYTAIYINEITLTNLEAAKVLANAINRIC
jgi:hypothetical protein